MEGMVSKELVLLQSQFFALTDSPLATSPWARGLITGLLEIAHGQWIYRNYVVHNRLTGDIATKHKEQLLSEIEHQLDLGNGQLLEANKYLIEIRLEDLENTSGVEQEYWLLAIKCARKAALLERAAREEHDDTTEEMGT